MWLRWGMGELLPAGYTDLRLIIRPGYSTKKSRGWRTMMDGELLEWRYKEAVDIGNEKLSFELS
jgi:hypothetical protein